MYWLQWLFGPLMFLTAVFLILLVLVQRGRGGGLAGALGGAGGQSAFGAKAGDLFTRITMVSATFWILLCVLAVRLLAPPPSYGLAEDDSANPAATAPEEPGSESEGTPDEKPTGEGE